ncbi:peptidoglycan D,D-transpeptidase FtsI family protein [Cellulomonas soli]|uniref:Cell division protein FtsI n=1 Tax=Cellulomonas soli TaxID=931535 RepID=A0A512PIA9_9CELL|nr:penicillin-binding transpeptidase domain-containing protein [Cellulomonas soli]NYI58671.1 peptidoglycan glycosyltransferase [Cellulomonas soli]GEP70944.1 cell division protein FtsI [Cellulomonas soli]
MNTPLRRLASVALAMFLVLMVGTTWIQYVQADSLNNDPRNVRTLYREYGNARGPIVVAGEAVASSVEVDDAFGYQRTYTNGQLYSTLTGFYSIVNGRTELEKYANDQLTGRSDQLFFSRLRDVLTGKSPEGAAVETTILPAAQQAALDALGDQQGAVVAIEPSTGKILALVSTPGFDPNTLATHDTTAANAAYQELLAADGNPLVSNATSERYPPGSTFKLVTAAAALESGDYTADTTLPAPVELDLPLSSSTLGNFGGGGCGVDPITLADALRVSCNTAFAQLGMDLGADALKAQADRFGFDSADLTIPMLVAESDFPENLDAPQTALAAIGQGSVAATPIQMAMVSAAIANGGQLMQPYVVQTVRSADLTVVDETTPSLLSTAVSPGTAATLTSMMVGVVQSGSGTGAQISGVQVAGKTGTAQTTADAAPHAWFTGFAPADNPQVAVAVLVEHGGSMGSEATGGKIAAPIAKAVIEAVLGS